MRRYYILLTLLVSSIITWGQVRVGEWTDYNAFSTLRNIRVTPERVYGTSRMAVCYYDIGELYTGTLTKSSSLSDAGISCIGTQDDPSCLVVGYTNSNIDVLRDGRTYPVPAIMNNGISGDKQLYHIRCHGYKAYLATGFGIAVLDLNHQEIAETYHLGNQGQNGVVYDVAICGDSIVAATTQGLMYAPRRSKWLQVYETWHRDTLSVMRNQRVRTLEVLDGRLVALVADSGDESMTLYHRQTDGSWQTLLTDAYLTVHCSHGHIVTSSFDKVRVYDSNGTLMDSLSEMEGNSISAYDADLDADGSIWLAHAWMGIVKIDAKTHQSHIYCPSGPYNDDYVYSVTPTFDKTYLAPGGKKSTYEGVFLPGNVLTYDGKGWSTLNSDAYNGTFTDVLQIAVDPRDSKHLSATSWGTGVLDIYDNTLRTIYNRENTQGTLKPYTSGAYSTYRVSGLAYDDNGDLWITNSLVDDGLVVQRKNGEWESFNISAMLPSDNTIREIDKIVWDSIRDYKWMAGRANRIYVHDGDSKMAYVNPNSGSKLETHSVTCLLQDRSGDIWFGTDKGIKVIYDGYKAFNNGGRGEQSPVNCSNILYNEDGIDEYLMAYESITCMAADGANRKWIGTANNGLYLISANGQEQIQHFTTSNSALASDKISNVAIHPTTGIVYICTDKGLQGYRSTATAAYYEPNEDIHAFPNPVKPNYSGLIAIKGFTRDALVHITDTRGHVVYSTQAFGGQAIWNGCTLEGKPVASGTYLVFASAADGKMRSVTKILIIR